MKKITIGDKVILNGNEGKVYSLLQIFRIRIPMVDIASSFLTSADIVYKEDKDR